jgi:copper/silver efflux system protein
MIASLIRFCVRNPVVVLVLTAALLGIGIDSWNDKTVDAIPDISENQVIVVTRWPGRSPEDVEDQITYPLSTQLAGVRGVKEIRSLSGFGFSQVYVVFDEPIRLLPSSAIADFYESRTRVLEKLSSVRSMLPEGVNPELGPDATALGQIFMYTVDGPYDLATLRSLQDFVVRYELQSVAGVSEVASVGGMVREYQVDVNPEDLRHYGAGMNDIVRGIRLANLDVGAKTIENGGVETIVRGLGFIKGVRDVEDVVIGTMTPRGFMPTAMRMNQGSEALAANHRPLLVRDVATVRLGPAFRRGALADGKRERVGGVVAMRFGENPRDVIAGVRESILRLNDPEVGILPEGVRVSPFYDRTQLIEETTDTLEVALREELIITVVVVLLFLFHFRTSLIIAATLPLAVLISFVAMRWLGVDSNIMSLTGIAIAIGTMVDMGIVMTENIYRRLEEDGGKGNPIKIVEDAAVEVGPALLTAVATTVISFVPIFFLEDQEGKLFRPLAWTKSLALVAAALVGVLVVPVLCRLFLTSDRARRKMVSFDQNLVSRAIRWAYEPTLRWVLAHKLLFLLGPALIVLLGGLAMTGTRSFTEPIREGIGGRTSELAMLDWLDRRFPGLGQEFMPALDEGSLLYMPSLLPAASLSQTLDVMKRQNAQIESLPEVAKVVGKLGRVESALDPAPIGMIETVVQLQPRSEWREGIRQSDIVSELMRVTHTPGVLEGAGAWLQPIETRVIMLNSGIRAPLAAKLIGSPRSADGRSMTAAQGVAALEEAANWIREVIQPVPGVAGPNVENLGGKPYLEARVRREEVGHWGLTVQDVQDAITTAIGGKVVDSTVEGRERYGIRVAYPRERRDRVDSIDNVLVHGSRGPVPLSFVADISSTIGPAAIKTEDGRLRLHVMFAAAGRDEGAVMEDALARIAEARREHIDAGHPDPIPAGVAVEAAGRYENQARAAKRFRVLIPICFAIILFLLYLNFRSWVTSLNVFAALPVCIGGGLLLLAFFPDFKDFMFEIGLWDQPSSGPIYITVAVIVGFIALAGIATDDGVVIATYLDQSMKKRQPGTVDEVREATVAAGLRRIRPCLMTTVTTIVALYPILSSTGRGSDVAQPMALPAVGGMLAGLISLFIVPLVYCWIQELQLGRVPSRHSEEELP